MKEKQTQTKKKVNKISQSETRLLKIEQSIKSIEDTLRIVKSRLGL
tara:strand:+ start:1026 stop:1163 length:138 start_codon:yes stop_codon:yes gene_type:complete